MGQLPVVLNRPPAYYVVRATPRVIAFNTTGDRIVLQSYSRHPPGLVLVIVSRNSVSTHYKLVIRIFGESYGAEYKSSGL